MRAVLRGASPGWVAGQAAGDTEPRPRLRLANSRNDRRVVLVFMCMRVATYLRVSTDKQLVENQRRELSAYIQARGWALTREYCDEGISGAADRRPALDELLSDARRRKFDTVLIWSLDRMGRSLRHLLTVIDELQSVNVSLVSLRDGLDLSSASGRLQLAVLGALSQFERDRLRERVMCGLERARAQGTRLGGRLKEIPAEDMRRVSHLSVRAAARELGVAVNTYQRVRRAVSTNL